MTRQQILVVLQEHVRTTFCVRDAEPIGEATLLVENLGADSLDEVEFVMWLEDTFKLPGEIPDSIAEKWKTLGDAVTYLEAQESVRNMCIP